MSALQGWTIQVVLATIGMIVADHVALDVGFALTGLVSAIAALLHCLGRR